MRASTAPVWLWSWKRATLWVLPALRWWRHLWRHWCSRATKRQRTLQVRGRWPVLPGVVQYMEQPWVCSSSHVAATGAVRCLTPQPTRAILSALRHCMRHAGSTSRLLRQMFHIKREEQQLWMSEDSRVTYQVRRTKFDGPSVQCCLRALRMACAPCSAQQAQQLLHEAIGRAVASADRTPARHLDYGCTLTVRGALGLCLLCVTGLLHCSQCASQVCTMPSCHRLLLADRERELQGWLVAIRFAVELGADANGSWEGVHTLRRALTGAIR